MNYYRAKRSFAGHFIRPLAIAVGMCVAQMSCAETHSFEGTVEANEEVDYKTDYARLSLNSVDETADSVIEIDRSASETGTIWLIDKAIIASIRSGGRQLAGRDLRIGQQLRVSFDKASVPQKSKASIEIINYSPPTKVLRVSLSLDVKNAPPEDAQSIEEDIITSLCWRLPPDVQLARSSEIADESNVIGELLVNYFRFSEKSDVYRTTDFMPVFVTHDVLRLETKFSNPNLSSNWTKLRLIGGKRVKEKEHRVLEVINETSFKKVPLFQMN